MTIMINIIIILELEKSDMRMNKKLLELLIYTKNKYISKKRKKVQKRKMNHRKIII